MLDLVALAFISVHTAADDFVPARDHGRHTVAEWIAEIERSPDEALDAIWSIYYADSRTIEVTEVLKGALVVTRNAETRRAIDTVLAQWQVTYEAPEARRYGAGHNPVAADELFQPPHNLESTNPKPSGRILTSLQQVIEALRSGTRTEEALDTIVGMEFDRLRIPFARVDGEIAVGRTNAWAREFAGTAYGEAVARRVRQSIARVPFDAQEWKRLLNAIPGLGRARIAAGLGLLHMLDAPEEARDSAMATLGQLVPLKSGWPRDGRLHWLLRNARWEDPDAQTILAELVPPRLAGDIDVQHLMEIEEAIAGAPLVVELVQPRLLELAIREDDVGIEAVRILGHLGVRDERLRRRYLEIVRGWSDFSDAALERFPCWKLHDEETLAAFAGAMERAEPKPEFEERFLFAGLTDARHSPIVDRYLSNARIRNHGHGLVREGFRGLYPLVPEERAVGRVNQLALRIATLKDDGQSFASEQEMLGAILLGPIHEEWPGGYGNPVEQGFFQARTLHLHSDSIVRSAIQHLRNGPPDLGGAPILVWDDQVAAAEFLYTAELTLVQELELRALRPWTPPFRREWWSMDRDSPGDTSRLAGPLAVELVPRIRTAIYGGCVQALDELLAITPLVARDEDYLLAVLCRGPATARQWAVELTGRRELDTPRLRDALRARGRDLDAQVRVPAQRLLIDRGW